MGVCFNTCEKRPWSLTSNATHCQHSYFARSTTVVLGYPSKAHVSAVVAEMHHNYCECLGVAAKNDWELQQSPKTTLACSYPVLVQISAYKKKISLISFRCLTHVSMP